MIELRNLGRRFGELQAVESLNLHSKQGEVLGILGPNGAGKTTTLRMITGALKPSCGEVLIEGASLSAKGLEARRKIGYLPEAPAAHGELRASENLRFIARLRGLRGAALVKAVEAVLARVQLSALREVRVASMSRGQRQRVNLAMALIGSPPVLVLDEPTLGLDPSQVLELRATLEDLRGDHTIILASHILAEVQKLCDRVLILSQGRQVALGSLEEVREQLGTPGADLEAIFQTVTTAPQSSRGLAP